LKKDKKTLMWIYGLATGKEILPRNIIQDKDSFLTNIDEVSDENEIKELEKTLKRENISDKSKDELNKIKEEYLSEDNKDLPKNKTQKIYYICIRYYKETGKKLSSRDVEYILNGEIINNRSIQVEVSNVNKYLRGQTNSPQKNTIEKVYKNIYNESFHIQTFDEMFND
jgi:hypothetical protein